MNDYSEELYTKACCVTGHRDISESMVSKITRLLQDEIVQAYRDGYRKFYSGMATGVDLIFVEILSKYKAVSKLDIFIEAVLPYRGAMNKRNAHFQRLVGCCDAVRVLSEQYYGKRVYLERNKYMFDNSQKVIAVYDGRVTGGTYFTIEYAQMNNKDLRIIWIE